MNRHERRAAKKRDPRSRDVDVILIGQGHLLEGDQNYGLPVNCYICATPHKAFGIARIEKNQSVTHVPLCEPCRQELDVAEAIMWRFYHVPNLKITEGGEATHEQVLALAERLRATAH